MTTENPNPNEADAAAAAAAAGESAPSGNADETTLLGGEGQAQKGQEGGGEAGKGEGEGGDQAAASKAPEKYELSAPDGFDNLDTDVLAEAEPVLRELDLSNEQAQQLMPLAGALVKKTLDRAEKAITDRAITQRKEWADSFDKDPDIGGANKDRTLADAARAFDHYGLKPDEGLRQLLNESGLGNHPDLIRFVARVGRDLDEGGFERGDIVNTPKTPEQKLYGAEFQPK